VSGREGPEIRPREDDRDCDAGRDNEGDTRKTRERLLAPTQVRSKRSSLTPKAGSPAVGFTSQGPSSRPGGRARDGAQVRHDQPSPHSVIPRIPKAIQIDLIYQTNGAEDCPGSTPPSTKIRRRQEGATAVTGGDSHRFAEAPGPEALNTRKRTRRPQAASDPPEPLHADTLCERSKIVDIPPACPARIPG
jgi:hypothetical protein